MSKSNSYVLIISLILACTASFIFPEQSGASVKGGVCSNCHTMHNSQDGSGMVLDSYLKGKSANGDCQGCHNAPREELLVLTCVGCHVKPSGLPIDSPDELKIPQVYYETGGDELAAGNFKYVDMDDRYGHNVHGVNMTSGGNLNFDIPGAIYGPPGYVAAMDPSPYDFNNDHPKVLGLKMVYCAGAFGCHGDRSIISQSKATAGTHHADDSVLRLGGSGFDFDRQGETPGTSYRYLYGVKGGEISDWEMNATSASHNEYYGADLESDDDRDTQDQNTIETMSQFCASCHGLFHMASPNDERGISTGGTNESPWIRHPTDVMIPDDTPYTNYTTYNLTAKVARINLPTSSSDQTQIGSNAVVFCLSCHKAHASQYRYMLRFSYNLMLANDEDAATGTGCLACHNDK